MNASQPSIIEQQHPPSRARVESVDVLRGLVMVIMALDHTRESFSNYGGNRTDAATAPGLLFFTRWIAHLCAPTFVFLAGTSIYFRVLLPARQRRRYRVFRDLLLWAHVPNFAQLDVPSNLL